MLEHGSQEISCLISQSDCNFLVSSAHLNPLLLCVNPPICEALSGDALESIIGALCIGHAKRCPVVVSEVELGDIAYWPHHNDHTNTFDFAAGTFPARKDWHNAEGIVPIVPVHLRPKRAVGNYHILWEAEWTKVVPRDPMLLRRITGDLWLVVAAWDLTEVERAALATRLNA